MLYYIRLETLSSASRIRVHLSSKISETRSSKPFAALIARDIRSFDRSRSSVIASTVRLMSLSIFATSHIFTSASASFLRAQRKSSTSSSRSASNASLCVRSARRALSYLKLSRTRLTSSPFASRFISMSAARVARVSSLSARLNVFTVSSSARARRSFARPRSISRSSFARSSVHARSASLRRRARRS